MASNTGCSSLGERLMTLEHLGGRGLVFERFCSSRLLACSASNSRVFSMAITAWSAKVFSSSICLSVNGARLRR